MGFDRQAGRTLPQTHSITDAAADRDRIAAGHAIFHNFLNVFFVAAVFLHRALLRYSRRIIMLCILPLTDGLR